jgi:hypothetical protein
MKYLSMLIAGLFLFATVPSYSAEAKKEPVKVEKKVAKKAVKKAQSKKAEQKK